MSSSILNTQPEKGELLKAAAKKAIGELVQDATQFPIARLFSARHEFPSEWHRFLHPKEDQTDQTLQLNLNKERFQFQFHGKEITINQLELFLKFKDDVTVPGGDVLTISITTPDGDTVNQPPLNSTASFLNGIPHAVMDVSGVVGESTDVWTLTAQKADIEQLIASLGKPDAIEDLIIVCHYSVA